MALHSDVLVYLNGRIMEADQARVSPFDRGFVFGDGIYEVLRATALPQEHRPSRATVGGTIIIGLDKHVARMKRSLRETGIYWDAGQIPELTAEMLAAAQLTDGLVYWQITRGTPDLARQVARSHLPPAGGLTPTVFGYARPFAALDWVNAMPLTKKCVVQPDWRWARCDIKSISLLGHVMGTIAAGAAGADEAILVREVGGLRVVAEGTYSNVALAFKSGEIVTPSLDSAPMLAGVTRELLLEACPEIVQRAVREEELREASEIMLVGTTTVVTSVTHLDGRAINGGVVGPVAKRLSRSLVDAMKETSGVRLGA